MNSPINGVSASHKLVLVIPECLAGWQAHGAALKEHITTWLPTLRTSEHPVWISECKRAETELCALDRTFVDFVCEVLATMPESRFTHESMKAHMITMAYGSIGELSGECPFPKEFMAKVHNRRMEKLELGI